MNNLNYLESEAIHIIREMISESENPVMLYSIGKDSAVMLHLIKKTFYPLFLHFHYCILILRGSLKKCTSSVIRYPKILIWI